MEAFLDQYAEYRKLIFLICNIITASSFFYFYIKSQARKHKWLEYYWKGFLIMSIAGLLISFGLIISFPAALIIIKKIVTISLGLYGFYLIILAGKMERLYKKEMKEKILKKENN